MTQIEIINTIRQCRTVVLISCTASHNGLPLFSRKHGNSIAVKIFCKQPFNWGRWHFYTKTRPRDQSVVNNIFLMLKPLKHLSSSRWCETNSPAVIVPPSWIGGKITTLVHYRRAGGWVTQGKEGKEVEEWWERRRAGGEALVQGTEGKEGQKGRRAGNVKSTHKYRAPGTYNHSNQGP